MGLPPETPLSTMELGAFSVSLSVKDLAASRVFYEKLGFVTLGGDADSGWLILRNGGTTIGLFQGLFEKNMLTFNPSWDAEANPLTDFADVREIQKRLREAGIEPQEPVAEDGAGPASIMVVDPDGNPVLIDQHV